MASQPTPARDELLHALTDLPFDDPRTVTVTLTAREAGIVTLGVHALIDLTLNVPGLDGLLGKLIGAIDAQVPEMSEGGGE